MIFFVTLFITPYNYTDIIGSTSTFYRSILDVCHIYTSTSFWRERERVLTIWYTMEATVMVQNRPTNASEIKAPSKGVKLAVPPKLVRVLAALVTGICSCVVKYLIILVLNPTTANFSQISFATYTHTHTKIHHQN